MKFFFLLFFLISSILCARESTVSIRAEFFAHAMKEDSAFHGRTAEHKSGFLAAALSAVVPGAGEVYVGDYLRAAPFVLVEGATLALTLIYTKKGDDATSEFEHYADEEIYAFDHQYAPQGRSRWSMVRYADWLNRNMTKLGVPANEQDRYRVHYDGDATKKDWERFSQSAIDQLHQLEERVTTGGQSFSHRLESHGAQQYYELIGKYLQYSRGWSDAGSESDTSGQPFINYGQSVEGTPLMQYYATLRGKANDLYSVAQLFLVVEILNHVASAVDAALLTRSSNHDLSFGVGSRSLPDGVIELYPTATLALRW